MIVFLFSGTLLSLMLQDVEMQKRILRRYMRRLDEDGHPGNPIGWWAMKFTLFVRPAWFFTLSKSEERPDLYSIPELVDVIEKIKMNYRVIKWVLLVFMPSAAVFALQVVQIVNSAVPDGN
ncbi:MAG: hypothetical protein IPM46_13060 [Flavobacteriales bacterium]|nr:hypothetical protein [Flavobacteriales bacterium]